MACSSNERIRKDFTWLEYGSERTTLALFEFGTCSSAIDGFLDNNLFKAESLLLAENNGTLKHLFGYPHPSRKDKILQINDLNTTSSEHDNITRCASHLKMHALWPAGALRALARGAPGEHRVSTG